MARRNRRVVAAMKGRGYVTVEFAVAKTGFNQSTFSRAVTDKKIEAKQIRGCWYLLETSLRAWLGDAAWMLDVEKSA